MALAELLKGERVKLTSVYEEDLSIFEKWYNDISFLRFYDMTAACPKSKDELEEMVRSIKKSNDSLIFAIRTVEDDKFIGVAGFENILWNNGNAVIYIGIGEEGHRGKGLAKEALNLAMEFAFQELNLHRIQLNVLEYNEDAIRLYERLGFKREGVYREFIHRDGKRYDMYLYGILRHEWNQLNI